MSSMSAVIWLQKSRDTMKNSKQAKVPQLLAEQHAERQEDLQKYISDPNTIESDTNDEGYS